MARLSRVVGHLRRVTLLHEADRLTDAQLVHAFLARREDAAFEALVRRHGPMILGVCSRLLHDRHDAEDAFQATFLVFLRKARTIRKPKSLASWLYGVARRTALEARKKAAQRRARERQVQEMAQKQVAGDNALQHLLPLLDHEMSRLPDKYRVPIILCDLEGKTRREAAHLLAMPEKTLSTRLDRARAMLAKRLARHGTTLPGGALAPNISQGLTTVPVPHSLVSSTVKMASFVAAGKTVTAAAISAKVVVLTEGVVKTMLLTKLKTLATVLAAVTILGSGVGALGRVVLAEKQVETQREGEKHGHRVKEANNYYNLVQPQFDFAAGIRSLQAQTTARPAEQRTNGQGAEKPVPDNPFENAPGHTWFRPPVKWEESWTPRSIRVEPFDGGSLTTTQMQDGSFVFILVGAEPGVNTGVDYRPVVIDREGKRHLAHCCAGSYSPNEGHGVFTKHYLLSAHELPAGKIAYLGIEAENIVAKDFEDFAQFHYRGRGVLATSIKDRGGFTVVPLEAPKERTKLCLSFALNKEQARPADFRVLAVDADGKRHESVEKEAVSGAGEGTAVITMVVQFNISSDSIRTLLIQRAKGNVQSRRSGSP